MTRDSVPKNSTSIANRVFKKLRVKTQDDYVITHSEDVCSAGFICQVYERAVGALIEVYNRGFKYSSSNVGKLPQ